MIDAVLLIGPTGSGKTPLGEALERTGWNGRRCLHFDFGARLREAAARPESVPGLSGEDRDVVRAVLRDGSLLEDRHFPIARKILENFLRIKGAAAGDLLVLNGLPRHAGQARDIGTIAAVRRIIVLAASPEAIRERIRTNTAGDRTERADDSPAEVERKVSLYEERTKPLIAYYEAEAVPVHRLSVAVKTTADELLGRLLKEILP